MAARESRKKVLLALKVDAATAAALEGLPNKSAFVREALRARLGALCPLCQGSGRRADRSAPAGTRERDGEVPRLRCLDCGRLARVVERREADAQGAEHELRRLGTWLVQGDFFCRRCHDRSRPCPRCRRRIPARVLARGDHACPARRSLET